MKGTTQESRKERCRDATALLATENDALNPGSCLLWTGVQASPLYSAISDKQSNPPEASAHQSPEHWKLGLWDTEEIYISWQSREVVQSLGVSLPKPKLLPGHLVASDTDNFSLPVWLWCWPVGEMSQKGTWAAQGQARRLAIRSCYLLDEVSWGRIKTPQAPYVSSFWCAQ